jgi:hypothetical protein
VPPPSEKGSTRKVFTNSTCKARPESGRDCLIRATFARQQLPPRFDLTRTSIRDEHSGSMKITTHLNRISHCKATPGTNWSDRWTNLVFLMNIRRDLIKRRQHAPQPLSSKPGTHKTVTARFRPWFSGKSPETLSSCSLLARKWRQGRHTTLVLWCFVLNPHRLPRYPKLLS